MFHYLKRIFETVFIHRFSNDTMPFKNLLKNCFHYYVTGGIYIAYQLYSPYYTRYLSATQIKVLTGLFFTFESLNFYAHLCLMILRPPGSRIRQIPNGILFRHLSCPNYFFETLSWLTFAYLTGLNSSWLFALIGYAQMQLWALKKHRRYQKDFTDYPKDRKSMIPFII